MSTGFEVAGEFVSVNLDTGEQEAPRLPSEREALLRRVGNIMRGDWSMNYFDGRDVKRWINTALDGGADALRELGEDLRGIEEDE